MLQYISFDSISIRQDGLVNKCCFVRHWGYIRVGASERIVCVQFTAFENIYAPSGIYICSSTAALNVYCTKSIEENTAVKRSLPNVHWAVVDGSFVGFLYGAHQYSTSGLERMHCCEWGQQIKGHQNT